MRRKIRFSRPGVPPPSSEGARRRMEAAKGKDTKAEMKVRFHLHRLGLRYSLQEQVLQGHRRRADLVFKSARVVVFVDGCFWHGCPLHGTWPKKNADFWRTKIEANRSRDADTNVRLVDAGWLVMRVWEHENALSAALRIAETVRDRRDFAKRKQ